MSMRCSVVLSALCDISHLKLWPVKASIALSRLTCGPVGRRCRSYVSYATLLQIARELMNDDLEQQPMMSDVLKRLKYCKADDDARSDCFRYIFSSVGDHLINLLSSATPAQVNAF